MAASTDTPPAVYLLTEARPPVEALAAILSEAGFTPNVLTFDELQSRGQIVKTPALIVLHFAQGLASDGDWKNLTILLSLVHNLFPRHYTMLLTAQAAPRFLAQIGLIGCQECHLAGPDDATAREAILAVLRTSALPPIVPVLAVPERVFHLCEQIGSLQQPDALAHMIVRHMTELMDADRSSVWIRDHSDGALRMMASRGLPEDFVRQAGPPAEGSIIDWVTRHNQPLILHESIQNTRFQSMASAQGIKSSLCLPMVYREAVLGVFTLGRTRRNAPYFSHSDMQACAVVASTAAVSLQNARLVDELLERERLAIIGQTIAGVAHCMKNIFTALNGSLFLLEHGITRQDFTEVTKALDILQRSSARLNMLVMNMLDFSKSRKAVREEIHLRELFDEVIHLLIPAARPKNIDIEVAVEPGAELVYLDQARLYRALVNLGTNAIDAMTEGGTLTLRARPGGDPIHAEAVEAAHGDDEGGVALKRRSVIIEVCDTGQGIPPETRERMFGPFFSTKGSKGTGLGLASVKQFVDEQDGRIEVETVPGAGTTFRLLF